MNQKILLVDDDEIFRNLVSTCLSSHGYKVSEVKNGKEAIEALHNSDPDLIILDILMPLMDGIETCHRIREEENIWDIPIMFLTGNPDDWKQLEAYARGCDDYIVKPDVVDIEFKKRFVAVVKKLIG